MVKNEGDKNHAYFHENEGEERLRGERKIKLLKHIFALYSLPLTFAKIFSLAMLARLHFIIQLKMQACNVTLPTPVVFSCIFGVIIPDSHLPKCTKTRLKWMEQNCV